MSLAQGFPNTFSATQQTQEVLKNTDNETKKIYTDINALMAVGGHAHTGNGSDGAKITAENIVNTPNGRISSTTVQAAINELDTEKISIPANSVQGDILFHNGTAYQRRSVGTSGQFLKTNGPGANPSWADIPTVVTIASSAEAIAGTNNTNMITPLQLRNGLNAGGTAPIFACRAWVNFNGTGTPAIRASGNVTSITDVGTGKYTVNLATPMTDDNYSVVVNGIAAGYFFTVGEIGGTLATNNFKINVRNGSGAETDIAYIFASVFR